MAARKGRKGSVVASLMDRLSWGERLDGIGTRAHITPVDVVQPVRGPVNSLLGRIHRYRKEVS